MRSLLSIGLAFVLVLPIWGSYLALRHAQYQVKRSVKQTLAHGLADSELVFMEFSFAEARNLGWKAPGEFKHKGHMYDVVRATSSDGRVQLWCWWDHEDSALEQQLDRLVRAALGGDADPNAHTACWSDWLRRVFFTPELHFAAPPAALQAAWPLAWDQSAGSRALAPHVPPPNA
jgi:hypothetical protein